jgi:hypothetical protein
MGGQPLHFTPTRTLPHRGGGHTEDGQANIIPSSCQPQALPSRGGGATLVISSPWDHTFLQLSLIHFQP